MKRFSKFLILSLVVLMVLPLTAFAQEDTLVDAGPLYRPEIKAQFADMPEGADGDIMAEAVMHGFYEGSDGYIRPYDTLTRAELATILVRAFKPTEMADMSKFTDVPEGAWYYESVSKAVAMGVLTGDDNGKIRPQDPVTRQEAFVMLKRAYKIKDLSAEKVENFKDGASVADWAKVPVESLLSNKYLKFPDGYIRPTDPITRLEFAEVVVIMDEDKLQYELYSSDEGWSAWV